MSAPSRRSRRTSKLKRKGQRKCASCADSRKPRTTLTERIETKPPVRHRPPRRTRPRATAPPSYYSTHPKAAPKSGCLCFSPSRQDAGSLHRNKRPCFCAAWRSRRSGSKMPARFRAGIRDRRLAKKAVRDTCPLTPQNRRCDLGRRTVYRQAKTQRESAVCGTKRRNM